MGYQPTTRSRAYREGWQGRRRCYHCRECGVKFQADILSPLSEIDKVCPECRNHTTVFTFVDKITGEEQLVRASDSELATLRAWNLNPNLTFKVKELEVAKD